jgi:hypothetical protein
MRQSTAAKPVLATPWHVPAASQVVSPSVHGSWSSHGAAVAPSAAVCVQPVFGSHESVVHGLLSSQSGGTASHRPLTHVFWQRGPHAIGSAPVHGTQVGSGVAWSQRPAWRSQLSSVQALLSLQSSVVWQQSAMGAWVHPASVQTSAVHGLLSLQSFGASGTHVPPWQVAGSQLVPHATPLSGVEMQRLAVHVLPLSVHGLWSGSF